MDNTHFFTGQNSNDYFASKASSLVERINKRTANDFKSKNIDELTEDFYNDFKVEIPTIEEDGIYTHEPEDVNFTPPRTSRRISGIRYTFVIPYNGGGNLFQLTPTNFSNSRPYGNTGMNNEIEVSYDLPTGADASGLKMQFEKNLDMFKTYLGWLSGDVKKFNDSLKPFIAQKLKERKEIVDKAHSASSDFGYPVRKKRG